MLELVAEVLVPFNDRSNVRTEDRVSRPIDVRLTLCRGVMIHHRSCLRSRNCRSTSARTLHIGVQQSIVSPPQTVSKDDLLTTDCVHTTAKRYYLSTPLDSVVPFQIDVLISFLAMVPDSSNSDKTKTINGTRIP